MAMRVSTKGRYALRVMVDLAEHNNGEYIPLSSIAERQGISEKYLEAIISAFSRSGQVIGQRGKGGGYKLAVDPEKFTAREVLTLVEGDMAPVTCLQEDADPCPMAATCRTLSMWKDFYDMTNKFFDGITIADLARNGNDAGDYSI